MSPILTLISGLAWMRRNFIAVAVLLALARDGLVRCIVFHPTRIPHGRLMRYVYSRAPLMHLCHLPCMAAEPRPAAPQIHKLLRVAVRMS